VDGPDLARFLGGRALGSREAAELLRTLAGAVHHAHQRGIIHRDLKPSNILLAGSREQGTGNSENRSNGSTSLFPVPGSLLPKITDFGLAKRFRRDTDLTQTGQVLGTPSYMAPEQAAADNRRVGPQTDVYALGAILYEVLTGQPPFKGESPLDTLIQVAHGDLVPPRRLRPDVPAALETICLKALERDPARRYDSAQALADDLERFLDGATIHARPESRLSRRLRQAWRHRVLLAVVLLLAAVGLTVGGFVWMDNERRLNEAAAALSEGRARLSEREFAEAARTLNRGLEAARQAHGGEALAQELEGRLGQARRGLAAQELHPLAERARFLFDPDALSPSQREALEENCRKVWDARGRILDAHGLPLDGDTEESLRDDLLDLALLWTELHSRRPAGQAEALAVLAEVEGLFGPGPVLAEQRLRYAADLGELALAEDAARQRERLKPRTAWENYALGRGLLRAGRFDEAAAALDKAVAEQPQGFWPHFYRGVCAYRRGQPERAVEALNLCIFQAPRAAACYHNRALAYTALGRTDEAMRDYDQALRLDSSLAAAALNRGLLRAQQKDFDGALADFRQALENGADPAVVYYNLAVVHERRQDRANALACVHNALRHDPRHAEARKLCQRLEKGH
jgi:tetratricopeptide (TPR) repeat protein